MIDNKYGKMINNQILSDDQKYLNNLKKTGQIPVYYGFTFPPDLDLGQAGSLGTGDGYFHVNTSNSSMKGGNAIYKIYKKK